MTGTRRKRDYFYTLLVNNFYKKSLYLNQRVGCLKNILLIDKKWLNLMLKLPVILNKVFINENRSVNQGNIGSKDTMNILIPLPPVKEEERIRKRIISLFNA